MSEGIRTPGSHADSAGKVTVSEKRGTPSGTLTPQNGPVGPIPVGPAMAPAVPLDLTALADALASLDLQDRQGIVAHVQALVRLSPARRQAIITLTQPVE